MNYHYYTKNDVVCNQKIVNQNLITFWIATILFYVDQFFFAFLKALIVNSISFFSMALPRVLEMMVRDNSVKTQVVKNFEKEKSGINNEISTSSREIRVTCPVLRILVSRY